MEDLNVVGKCDGHDDCTGEDTHRRRIVVRKEKERMEENVCEER